METNGSKAGKAGGSEGDRVFQDIPADLGMRSPWDSQRMGPRF